MNSVNPYSKPILAWFIGVLNDTVLKDKNRQDLQCLFTTIIEQKNLIPDISKISTYSVCKEEQAY